MIGVGSASSFVGEGEGEELAAGMEVRVGSVNRRGRKESQKWEKEILFRLVAIDRCSNLHLA